MQGTAPSRYSALESKRDPFLRRARKCATLTLPALLPEEGHTAHATFVTPYQSMGARGVNNLSSKLLLALFPPNTPFFKYAVDDITLEALTQQEGMRAEVEKALGIRERAIVNRMETSAHRPTLFEGLKHLVVTGNPLLYLSPKTKALRLYSLDQFVILRSPEGKVLEIVVKEQVSKKTLPDAVVAELDENTPKPAPASDSSKVGDQDIVDLYTHVFLKNGRYYQYQQAGTVVIRQSTANYPSDKLPWFAPRIIKIDGESYGRSYVEEYYGDLQSLEGLQKAMLESAAAAAKVIFFIRPGAQTRPKEVSKTKNGGFVVGNPDDVTALQLDKFADMRIAKELADELTQRLAFAFLLNSAIQRGGERVTAEEIRYMARELEDALGGAYSILSQELQLPYSVVVSSDMERENVFAPLPDAIKPMVVTGIEALGRGHDLEKLDLLLGGALQVLGPEAVATRINVSDYITRRATALGVDLKGLIKSEEQIQQEQQQAMMMQMMNQLGPNAINKMGDMAMKEMDADNVETGNQAGPGG